jgi:hypothetical protein
MHTWQKDSLYKKKRNEIYIYDFPSSKILN